MKNKIEVKLEDFEKYRLELTRYASGLLRTQGFGNNKIGELDALAKDIVQNTYLTFHNHANDSFVSEFHLSNFLKMVLYNRYREQFNLRSRSYKYTSNKTSIQDWNGEHPVDIVDDSKDIVSSVEKFIPTLKEDYKNLIVELMSGKSGAEIAREQNVSRQTINEKLKVIRNKYKEYESKNN